MALANKMARVAWALMTRGEVYRRPAAATASGRGVIAVIRAAAQTSRNDWEWKNASSIDW